MPIMPNLIGTPLSGAEIALKNAGVLNQTLLGYFGIWPITVSWRISTASRGTVTAQSPSSGANVALNPAILLTVSDLPIGMVYP